MLEEEPKKQRKKLKEVLSNIGPSIASFGKESVYFAKFLVLLIFVFIYYVLQRGSKRKVSKPNTGLRLNLKPVKDAYAKVYNKVILVFDTSVPQAVKSSDLILLAIKNLSYKRNRTYVTIVGMAIGFGAVILLLSAGFGFERLVISRVASLSEMKQVEVNTAQGSKLTFNADTINKIDSIDKVEAVVPIVTSVAKVTYNNAVSDVIVYGVNTRYFQEVGISPLKGAVFKEDDLKLSAKEEDKGGVVAGASTVLISKKSFNQEISKVRYSIFPLVWKPVYAKPDKNSQIIGYTKRDMGEQEAVEVWGFKYTGADSSRQGEDLNGKKYSPWVKDSFPLWKEEVCKSKNLDCVEGKYVVVRDGDIQSIKTGYISEDKVSVERYEIAENSSLEVYNKKIVEDVTFKLKNNDNTVMYLDPASSSNSAVVLDANLDTLLKGNLMYGERYDSESGYFIKNDKGVEYGYWVKAELTLWSKDKCDGLCESYLLTAKDSSYTESKITVYLKASDVNINNFSNVLGAETANGEEYIDVNSLKEDDDIDWVSISSELGTTEEVSKDIKALPKNAQKLALVNTTMLTLLGIDVNDAVGKKFEATIIFDSKLFDKTNYLVESEVTSFEIFGIVSDSKSPTFYMPLNDITVEGMTNVSQLKVVVADQGDVAGARESIEGMGFQTGSVVDTVDSISALFKSLRIALFVIGLIALGVASLGMFNTLTVSLLEKSREVGLLKTMGLKSGEVKTLFLAESIIMSVLGGVAGLLVAFGVGKLISLLLTLLAITQGQSALDVTYIPILLGASIVLLSAVVGVLTGWYPAKRAKEIQALNALRYE